MFEMFAATMSLLFVLALTLLQKAQRAIDNMERRKNFIATVNGIYADFLDEEAAEEPEEPVETPEERREKIFVVKNSAIMDTETGSELLTIEDILNAVSA